MQGTNGFVCSAQRARGERCQQQALGPNGARGSGEVALPSGGLLACAGSAKSLSDVWLPPAALGLE